MFAKEHGVVEKASRLADAFRAAGAPVIHVVTDATATISEEFQRAALDYALTTVATRATADEVSEVLARP